MLLKNPAGRPRVGNYKLLLRLSDEDNIFIEKIRKEMKFSSKSFAIRHILRMFQALTLKD